MAKKFSRLNYPAMTKTQVGMAFLAPCSLSRSTSLQIAACKPNAVAGHGALSMLALACQSTILSLAAVSAYNSTIA